MADSASVNYSYASVPTLKRFTASNAFIRGIVGPFGSGKSSASVMEFVPRIREQARGPDGIRRTRWGVVRGTYPMLRDTTIKTFHEWLPPHKFGRYYEQQHRYVVRAFDGCEAEFLFRALDKPDDIKQLLSLDLTGAWVNEGRETPWAIIDALQGRIGRYPPRNAGGATWAGMWLDTNPPDVDSEWFRFFEEGSWRASFRVLQKQHEYFAGMKESDFAAIFRQPSGVSPSAENLPNLRPGYYQLLSVGKRQEWVKVYVDGEYGFVSDNRAVFTEYSDVFHLQEADPVDRRPIMRLWDFGLTPACAFTQVLPDGRWLIFDEMQAESMGIDRFSDQVLEHCGRAFRGARVTFEDYGDPAGEQRAQTDERTCFQILQAKSIDIRGAEQDPTLRIECVRKALTKMVDAKPLLVLHPRCRRIRKGFLGAYFFRRLKVTGERFAEKPEKNMASHLMDCIQYGATILFGSGLTTDPRLLDDFPDAGDYADERGRSVVTGY